MTEYRPAIFNPESIGFHITSNDYDLLLQVRKHMQKSGYLAVSDTAGRLHYIMDGTRGVPLAARRVLETAERYITTGQAVSRKNGLRLPAVVEGILDQTGIRTELKGRAFLREILLRAAKDERQLNPACKTLYPEVARFFHVSASQVERDIRYAVTCARQQGRWPASINSGNSACISYLCSEVRRELRQLALADENDQAESRQTGGDPEKQMS